MMCIFFVYALMYLFGHIIKLLYEPFLRVKLSRATQRLLSAAPLATATDRHERWCATTPHDRAQLRGRASGVRCKAMLGRRLRLNIGLI